MPLTGSATPSFERSRRFSVIERPMDGGRTVMRGELRMSVERELRPLAKPFVIARGSITNVEFVTVRFEEEHVRGWGEACPVPHYGESVESVIDQIGVMLEALSAGEGWPALHDRFAPGAARNAVDCAHWDWQAKRDGVPVWTAAGLERPATVQTVFTIGLDTPDAMAAAAVRVAPDYPLLKIKLGADGDAARLRAIRAAAPQARLIADANEGWSRQDLIDLMPELAACGVEMLEQPLRAGLDHHLAGVERLVPLCADESCHTTADLTKIAPYYDIVNIKLDKTGGLTEALRLADAARASGKNYMVGCMLGTSLAMAPTMLVAQGARYADLDAPLLMGSDRTPALSYSASHIAPAAPELWG